MTFGLRKALFKLKGTDQFNYPPKIPYSQTITVTVRVPFFFMNH
jgi:hypothetical protein